MKKVLTITLILLFSFAAFAQSNSELKIHFEADQQARSPENLKNGIFPDFNEEVARRIYVFQSLSDGTLKTANDYFRASVILQHTNLEYVGEELKSIGNENHLLAHVLARKAYELGHKKGAWLMAATYNRYLENAGIDINKYGLDHKNNQIFAKDSSVSNEERVENGLITLTLPFKSK